jgi:hypothetical protein
MEMGIVVKIHVPIQTRNLRLHGVFTNGETKLPGVFITGVILDTGESVHRI